MIAIRGAVRVPRNERETIHRETGTLLREMQERNGFRSDQVVSAFFTMTPDLDADFPARAARSLGWTSVPMLGAQETAVPGALDRVVRVLVHVEAPGPARHVYLGEASAMRPDLAEEGDAEKPGRPPTRSAVSRPLLVCGLGLIGGSVALAARRAGCVDAIWGQDPDPRALELARTARAISRGAPGPEAYLSGAPVVLLAMPVDRILAWLERWGPELAPGTVVLDTGSTKVAVTRAMDRLPSGVEAIGGHPLAGSERSGMGAARPDLFQGATWALVETRRTGTRARAAATGLVEAMGARSLFVGAEEHDRVVAVTSHLPYLVSAVLASQGGEGGRLAAGLAGPGLRDMTRLAASDPSLMAGILATNRGPVENALREFRSRLEKMARDLEAAHAARGGTGEVAKAVAARLGGARSARERLFGG